MSYTRLPRRVRFVTSRARTEAYAGLFLLVLGLTVLAFSRCPGSDGSRRSRPADVSLRASGGKMPPSVRYGNALHDGRSRKGWWVGHFVETDSPRYSSQIETKWISHQGGEKHKGFSANKVATSMAVLVSGKHRIEFEKSYTLLETPGDYAIWGPGVAHSWSALEDSTLLCIRWPSLDGDQVHSFVNASAPRVNLTLWNETRSADSKRSGGISRNTSTELNVTLPIS